jgi:hypothetical protein
LHGAEEDLDAQTENHQVQQHLNGDEEAGRLGLGGDVAEPDGGRSSR